MRHLALVFGAFAFVACGAGGQLDDRFDPGLAVSAVPSGPEDPSYFLASSGAATMVVAVHPDTGAVVPFGPALPSPPTTSSTSTPGDFFTSIVHADDQRVIVESIDLKSDSASIVWVGDGASWKEIARAASVTDAVSSDGMGVVLSRGCDEVSGFPTTSTLSVVELDGVGTWRELTCPPADSPSAIARGPNGKYLVVTRPSGLYVRSREGVETAVIAPASAKTQALFESSFLATWDGHAAWFDTDGSELVVPGTATDPFPFGGPARGMAPFQVSNGALSSIADRRVERLQALPPAVAAAEVGAILPGHYAIATQGAHALVIGLDGATLATFDAGAPYDTIEVLAQAASAPWPWMIFASGHFTPTLADDVGDIERVHTLYMPGDPASGKPARSRILAHGSTDGLSRSYWPSASGRFLFYLDNQGGDGLHALEIETQKDVRLDSGYGSLFR